MNGAMSPASGDLLYGSSVKQGAVYTELLGQGKLV